MQGLHLTADLYQCRCDDAWLTDAQQLEDWCVRAVREAGLVPLGQLFEAGTRVPDGGEGITASVLLAGSHICLHTWPQQRTVNADVFLCHPDTAIARGLMETLLARFQPQWTEQRSLDRGDGSS
ncbi:MAG: S-adenosylmethionine decarboxylase [Pseudomonadota bacterium]|nr:S-adenosylmethionine decarboxylase [Pseudomonadota bacterium]